MSSQWWDQRTYCWRRSLASNSARMWGAFLTCTQCSNHENISRRKVKIFVQQGTGSINYNGHLWHSFRYESCYKTGPGEKKQAGNENSEWPREWDNYHARKLQMLLDKGQKIHFILSVRGSLWTLQCCHSRWGKHRIVGSLINSYSTKQHTPRKLERRPAGDAGEDSRSMLSWKAACYTALWGRLQLLYSIHCWQTGNANSNG